MKYRLTSGSVIYRISLLLALIALVTLPITGRVLAQSGDNPKPALRQTDKKDTEKGTRAYYVRYREGRKRAALAAINVADVQITHELDTINTIAMVMSNATLVSLQNNPDVEFIEPVPEHHPAAQVVPWNIDMVQARDVWDADRDGTVDPGAPDGSGIKLCIIDSGFYAAHDDFQGITVSGESQISGENWWEDGLGHGTHVAGIANAVNNTIGVVGVMPGGAELYIVKIFDNAGNWVFGQSNLAAAAQACRDAGANAISMSLNGAYYSATEDAVFQYLYDNDGIINIAAAGNDGEVEAVFDGEESKVKLMIEFCKRGPPLARVEKVEVEEVNEEEKFQEFLVHDLGLGEPEADRLMRMSFWKNYVTLQGSELSSVNATASDELQWEKRLKRAGFRAMGIPLLEPVKSGVQKGGTASKAGKEAMS